MRQSEVLPRSAFQLPAHALPRYVYHHQTITLSPAMAATTSAKHPSNNYRPLIYPLIASPKTQRGISPTPSFHVSSISKYVLRNPISQQPSILQRPDAVGWSRMAFFSLFTGSQSRFRTHQGNVAAVLQNLDKNVSIIVTVKSSTTTDK
jgi:hypothetical protein